MFISKTIAIGLAALIPALAQAKDLDFDKKVVSFNSGSNTLSGVLFTPHKPNNKAVTIIGPVGFVKEQSPMLYAAELASKGYTALIFDPTYHGASEGEPRRFESGDQKTKDIVASVDFLEKLDASGDQKIYGLGICQGINWMVRASNLDNRITSVSLVAGHYLHPDVAVAYNGGETRLASQLSKSRAAREKYSRTGEVEYIPIVGTADQDALLAAPPVYDWYIPWENNTNGKGGQWENRITRMSVLDIWGGNTEADLKALHKPTLVIHSDRAASGPDVARQLYAVIPAKNKELVWFEDQVQTMFYDDLPTIRRSVQHIDEWFGPDK